MTRPGDNLDPHDTDHPEMDPVDLEPDARDLDNGPPTVEQRWAYAGVRTLDGKKTHALIDESGTGATRYYSGVRAGLVIGEIYRVTISHRGQHTILHGDPRYAADGRVDTDLAAVWRAHDITSRSRLALARQHRQTARHDQLRDGARPTDHDRGHATHPGRPDRVRRLRPDRDHQRMDPTPAHPRHLTGATPPHNATEGITVLKLRCPYCGQRFATGAALDAHAPCPERATGDHPGQPDTTHRPSIVDVLRPQPAERWWLVTWTATTAYTERITGDELWHDLPPSLWHRFGDSARFDPADLDPAALLELMRRFKTEHTADAISERSLRTIEATTDPHPGPDETDLHGDGPR